MVEVLVNELEEFRAYTEFPEYKAEKKSDTAYLGRFTLPMLLELTGFQRILTILARGYLFRDGSDGYDRIEVGLVQPVRGENKKSPGSGE